MKFLHQKGNIFSKFIAYVKSNYTEYALLLPDVFTKIVDKQKLINVLRTIYTINAQSESLLQQCEIFVLNE